MIMDEEFTLAQEAGNESVQTEINVTSLSSDKESISSSFSHYDVKNFYEDFVEPAEKRNLDLTNSESYKGLFSSGDITAKQFFNAFSLPIFTDCCNFDIKNLFSLLENWEIENQSKNKRDTRKCEAISTTINIVKGLVRYPEEVCNLMEDYLWKHITTLIQDKCKDGNLELEEYNDLREVAEKTGLSNVKGFQEKFIDAIRKTYENIRTENKNLPEKLKILDVESSIKDFINKNNIELATESNTLKVFIKYKEFKTLDDSIKKNTSRTNWSDMDWKKDFDCFCENYHITLKDVTENFYEKVFKEFKLKNNISNLSYKEYCDISFLALSKYGFSEKQWKDFVKKENILYKTERNLNKTLSKNFLLNFLISVAITILIFILYIVVSPGIGEVIYEKGNYKLSSKILYLPAKFGNPEASFRIGYMYENGCLEQNYMKAIEYYIQAAEHGHVSAQYNLGVFYENGDVVPQDYDKALKYYQLAAEQGDEDAIEALEELDAE